MKKNKIISILSGFCLLFALAGTAGHQSQQNLVLAKTPKTVVEYNRTDAKKARQIEKSNNKTEKQIVGLDQKIARLRKELKKYSGAHAIESVSAAQLAQLNYHGKDVITVDNNDPSFSKNDLTTS